MKDDFFYKNVVLKNFAVFKKYENENNFYEAIKNIDDFLLHLACVEFIAISDFLNKNKNIKDYAEIKRLNDKYGEFLFNEKERRKNHE